MQVLTETSGKAGATGQPRLAFGDVSIDPQTRRVRAPNGASDLEPRSFDLLMTLAERPGLTVSHDYLIETVWRPVAGRNETLGQAMAALGRALGDDARAPRFIETVPGLGYRWIFEEPPGRAAPPPSRWSLGPAWVAAGAVLAIAVGGAGGVGAYALTQTDEPDGFEIHKTRTQRLADGRCVKQIQVIQGQGAPSSSDRAPPRPSSPGCPPAPEPRTFVQR